MKTGFLLLASCFFVATEANSGDYQEASNDAVRLFRRPRSSISNNFSTPTGPVLTLTLGLVVLNPNITDSLLRHLVMTITSEPRRSEIVHLYSFLNFHRTLASKAPHYRLQINPINAYGMGLYRLVKNLFCSRLSQNTNALFLVVDKAASVRNSQGAQMVNALATLASYIGLPTLAWTSSAAEFNLATAVTPLPFPFTGDEGPPLIIPKPNFYQDNAMETILLSPPIKNQVKAIYALLKRFFNHHKVTVIASMRTPGAEAFLKELDDIMQVEDRRPSLFDFDSHQGHMSSRIVQILRLDNSLFQNIGRELLSIRDHSDSYAFILFANHVESDKILEEAHHYGMTSSSYVWICGKPSLDDNGENTSIPPNYVPGLIAVTYNTSLNAQQVALQTAIQLWSEGVRKFFHLMKATGLQPQDEMAPPISCNTTPLVHWASGQLFYRAIKHRLLKLTPSSSKLTRENTDTDGGGFQQLGDIIYVGLQFNRVWKRIGVWRPSTGIEIDDAKWTQSLEKQRRQAAKNKRLRIATLEEPPYVVYEIPDILTGQCDAKAIPCRLSPLAFIQPSNNIKADDVQFQENENEAARLNNVNGSLMCCVGYSMDLLRRLSIQIGFEFELFEVYDRKWGARDKATGKWNGLVQALLDGSADMVVTSLKINSDRNSVIDFSVPFFETGITILVRVREGIVSAVAFLEPFSSDTWFLLFFGCVNVFTVVIFMFELLHDRLLNFDNTHRLSDAHRYSLAESLYTVLNMLFNSITRVKAPKSLTTQMITTLWSFVCVILVASFMANLAAFMITDEDYYNFSGVDDYRFKNPYTKNPAWRYATIPSGATETIMRTNFPEMHEYMRPFMRPNADAGVEAVKKGELDAFIYDASVLEYKVGSDRECQLRTVGKWYAHTGYGIALPKNSDLLNIINTHIVEYQRSGYLQHLEEYWLTSACKERQKRELRKSHALGIVNLKAVFAILIGCIVGCLLFLGVEHLFMRHCRRKLRRIDKCNFFALVSPKMGAAMSFQATVQMALEESRRHGRIRRKSFRDFLVWRKSAEQKVPSVEEQDDKLISENNISSSSPSNNVVHNNNIKTERVTFCLANEKK